MIDVRLDYALTHVSEQVFAEAWENVRKAHRRLLDDAQDSEAPLGWLELPERMQHELERIESVAQRLRECSDVIVIVGIGGSYLGAKAVIEAFQPYFDSTGPEVVFAGHHLSEDYLAELVDYLADKRFSINVISKSGTTTEPAIAFRVLRDLLERTHGSKAARRRIVTTTDREKGALRKLADAKGYDTFVVPDDVGGRYSVLSAVGLLPIAAAGFDIRSLTNGAGKTGKWLEKETEDNPALTYAAMRNALYESGKKVELFVHYEPKLRYLAEWWKQLFGESEGKEGKGLFVSSAAFTTDLHSLGQYIQEGERHLFETVLEVVRTHRALAVPEDPKDGDGLNYLAGQRLQEVNRQAAKATTLAHHDGGAPNIRLSIESLDGEHLGALLYFFEFSCAISGYVLGVDPFNQPGVEAYKQNMFALLGKPGFEALGEDIRKRLK